MNKLLIRRNLLVSVSLLIALILATGLAAATLLRQGKAQNSPSADDQLKAAWQRARASGAYEFNGDVTQVTLPTARITNVGRGSKSTQLHVEGQTDVRQNSLEMKLWSQDGSVAGGQGGLGVKVENGKSYMRQGSTSEWKENTSISTDGIAPNGDFMSFLRAVRNVQAHEPETKAGLTFTRYTFEMDGPAFASFVRDQMEDAMRAKGELVVGTHLDVPTYYSQMTGDGELWVHAGGANDGLPLRQILNLNFPDQRDSSVHAQLKVNFIKFAELPVSGITRAWRTVQEHLPSPLMAALVLLSFSAAGFLFVFYSSKRVQRGLTVALITMMVSGPALNGIRTGQIVDARVAKAATEQEQQKEVDASTALKAMDASSRFSPNQNPVQAAELRAREEARLANTLNAIGMGGVASAPAQQAILTDNGVDTDADGLSDFTEERVGTDPKFNDSDEDGLLDGVEVKGFTMGGKTWYLNPNEADSNGDGIGDAQEYDNDANNAADDTDGDGLPDVFDTDNDNDGVPDNQDTAPFTRSTTTFSDAAPLKLTLNGLQAGKTTFVDFQIRPQTASHLWFAFNVLDWPQDADGQMRDIDGKTFADLGGSGATDGNGDMRLIPMLEIRVPDSGANLPTQADLTPYNITVNNFTADGKTKLIYVPLSVVTDEKTGERVAFNARMRYLPGGTWPNPNEVRLVWNVLALSDMACDPKAANAAAQGCGSDGYVRNVGQVLHSYADSFSLTGMNVTEDNGSGMAIIYEDPAVDTNLKDDYTLTALSHGLDNSFLAARDEDNNGQRDVTLSEIQRRFDRNQNSAVSAVQRWGTDNILRVELKEYDLADQASVFTAMTETKRILNNVFAPLWQNDKTIKPLLMFAQEQRFRGLSLDGSSTPGGFVTLSGADVRFNMAPAGQTASPVLTSASVKWTPYCAPTASSPSWQPCESDVYWTEMENRYGTSVPLAGDPANNPNVAEGRVAAAQMYVQTLMQGVNRVVQMGSTRVANSQYSLKTDSQLDVYIRIGASVGKSAVAAIAGEIVTAKFINKVTMLEHFGRLFKEFRAGKVAGLGKDAIDILRSFRSGGHINRLVGTAIVGGAAIVLAGLIVGATFLANAFLSDDPKANLGAKITIKVLIVAVTSYLSTISPLKDLYEWSKAVKAAGSSLRLGTSIKAGAQKAGAVGTLIAVAVTWGFFIYSMVQNKVSAFSPEFNKAFAEAIATTIYLCVTFVISSTVIGTILVAIIALIDGILTAICELGVDELRKVPGLGGACFTLGTSAVKILAYFLYNYEPMIDTSRTDMVVTGQIDVNLADPSKGYIAGNSVSVSLPITTSIRHKNPNPEEGLLINLFLYLFSQGNLRSSTYAYSLSAGNAPQTLTVARDQMPNAWNLSEREDKYVATTMYKAYAATNPPAPVTGIPLNAGLNQPVDFNMNMGYAIPAYECWLMPFPFLPFVPPIPVCYTRELAGSTSTKFDNLKYDVYPATLDGFMALRGAGNNNFALAWDANFPAIKDADGDGLLSNAAGGLDPNDNNWDSDGDGLSDTYELERRQAGTAYSPISCDTDLDGLTDRQEMVIGSDPAKADSDNDGLKDGDEVWHQVYAVSNVNNVLTCTPTANYTGGWDVTVNAATPFVVHVSSNPLLADGDSDGVSDLAEKQLAQSSVASQRLDAENRPYHPNILNSPPIQVYTAVDDADGIVGLGQAVRYTTTIVANSPLGSAVLDVVAPAVLGGSPTPYALVFGPTAPQTVTQGSNFNVQANASTQVVAISSTVRARLGNIGTPNTVFDSIVSEPQLGSFAAPNAARQVGLAASRPDRQDSFLLSTLTSTSTVLGGNGDIVDFLIPGGASSAIENDGNNIFAKRGNTAPAAATNSNGDSLVVWEQKERCNVITITAMSVGVAADDPNGGIEPRISLKSETSTPGLYDVNGFPVLWDWTTGGGTADMKAGNFRGQPNFGFPIVRTVCGSYTIQMWESDGGGDENAGAQTIDSMAALGKLTLSFSGAGHTMYVDVDVQPKDEYVLAGALVGANGAVKKYLSFARPPVASPLYKTKSFGPSVASDGSGFVVAYEAVQVKPGTPFQWAGETDSLTYLAAQAFDKDGNATGNSAGFAYFQNSTGQRSIASHTAWVGNTYRTVLKALNRTTIDFVDFSTTASLGTSQFGPNDGATGTDAKLNAPQIAYDPVNGRWLLAYLKGSGQPQFNLYPNVGSITPSVQQIGSGGAIGVSAAFNPILQGWMVAGLFNNGLYSVNPLKLNDLTAQTTTFEGWTLNNLNPAELACPLPASQPVADLRFEELPGATAFADSSGRGNNATPIGTAPIAGLPGATGANGVAAGTPASDFAASFNGSAAVNLNTSLTDDFSVAFWIKVKPNASNNAIIIDQGANVTNGWTVWMNGQLGFLVGPSGLFLSPARIDNDVWRFVVVTRERATGRAVMYVDGAQVNTTTTFGTAALNAVTNIRIGNDRSGARGFNGLLDNVQFYATDLSADTVKALYDRTQQNYCVAARPTANGSGVAWAKLVTRQNDVRGGKITVSNGLTLTIDGDKPTSALTSLKEGQYVEASVDRSTNRVLMIGGNATDPTSNVKLVEVSINNGPWQAASGTESWSFPLELKTLYPDRIFVYNLRTRATDALGNVETAGAGITINADATGPQAFWNGLPGPVAAKRNAAGKWIVTLTGPITDVFGDWPSSGIKPRGVTVQLIVDRYGTGLTPPQTAIVSNGNWVIDYNFPSSVTDAPPVGIFNVNVSAEDNVGLRFGDYTISGFKLNVDSAGPNAALTTTNASSGILTNSITSTVQTIAGVISDTGNSGLDGLEVAFAPITQVVPLTNSVLQLSFEEDANAAWYQDSSGQFNSGYCTSNLSCPTSGVPGRIGRGLQFGTRAPGSQVFSANVPPRQNLNFVNRSFSVQGWVKLGNTVPYRLSIFSNVANAGTQIGYDLQVAQNTGKANWRLMSYNGLTPNSNVAVTGGPDLRDNQWHYVVGVYNHSNTTSYLYVDGVQVASAPVTGGAYFTGNTLSIGDSEVRREGFIDEVSVIASALGASDVQALYRVGDKTWYPAALAQRGATVTRTTWSMAVPTGLEGIYQMDLRSRDLLGNKQLGLGTWRGIVDVVAPRVTFTGTATGQSYLDANTNTRQYEMRYVCRADDWQLNEATFECAGNSAQTPSRGFNTDPALLAQFPSLSLLNTMSNTYTVWQANTQPVGSARVCDGTGKCSTATLAAAVQANALQTNMSVMAAHAPATTPSAVIVDPSAESVVAQPQGSTAVQVTLAAEASHGLKMIELYVDDVLQSTIEFAEADAVKTAIRTVTIPTPTGGAHVLTAKATDWAGNTQAEPASATVTFITGLPSVEIDSEFVVLTDTYGLRSNVVILKGRVTTENLAAVKVRVNNGRWADARFADGKWEIAMPVRDLQSGKALNVTVDAIDRFGQVKQHNMGEQVMLSEGGNPPDTSISEGPAGVTDMLTATVSFSGTAGDRDVFGFECQVDEGGYAPCASPQVFGVTSNGEHTLRVRAIDADGYVDPTPASVTWTVRVTQLEVTLTGAPSRENTSRDAQFKFEATDASGFECAIDGGEFASCNSPQTYGGLEDGQHEFMVRAIGGAATRYTWTIVNSVPVAQDQDITVASNNSVAINLSAMDSDVLHYKVLSKPLHGALFGLAPNLTYVPNTSFVGEDSFMFKATDAESDSEPATVHIKVTEPEPQGKSTLTIKLDAQPDAKQNFRFTSNLGNFRLDDANPDDGDAYGNSITFEVTPQRTYEFEEQVPGGWKLADIVCDTPHQVNVPAATAEIVVNNNEQVTCTFVNVRRSGTGVLGEPVDEDEAGYEEIVNPMAKPTVVFLPLVAK